MKWSKAKLPRVNQEIFKKAHQQEAVRNVFEDAIRTALSWYEGSVDEDGNEGLFPTQAPESPRRNLLDGEGTIFSSSMQTPRLRRSSHDCTVSTGSFM
jgi:hypothetical protein